MPSEREKHFHPRAVLSESRDLPARGQGTTLNEVVIWGGGKVGETPERWRAGEAGPGLRGGQVLQRSSVQREWLPPGGRGGRCPQATPEAGGQDGRMVWRPGRDASAASLCRFLSGLFGVHSLSDYVLFGGASLMGTRPRPPPGAPGTHNPSKYVPPGPGPGTGRPDGTELSGEIGWWEGDRSRREGLGLHVRGVGGQVLL